MKEQPFYQNILKKKYLPGVIMFLGGLICPNGFCAENLLPDPGFESKDLAKYWVANHFNGSGGTAGKDNKVYRSGCSSMLVEKINFSGYADIYNRGVEVQPKTDYTVSVYCYSPQMNDSQLGFMVVELDANNHRILPNHFSQFHNEKKTFDLSGGKWKEKVFSFKTRPNVKSLEVHMIFSRGQGKIWLDDMELKKGKPVKVKNAGSETFYKKTVNGRKLSVRKLEQLIPNCLCKAAVTTDKVMTQGSMELTFYGYNNAVLSKKNIQLSSSSNVPTTICEFKIPDGTVYMDIDLVSDSIIKNLELSSVKKLLQDSAKPLSIAELNKYLSVKQQAEAIIKPFSGFSTIYVNSQVRAPLLFLQPPIIPYKAFPENAKTANIDILILPTSFLSKDPWLGYGKYDFSEIDKLINWTLAAYPDAFIIVDHFVKPPQWWGYQNPDEICMDEKGRKIYIGGIKAVKFAPADRMKSVKLPDRAFWAPSLSSRKYAEDSAKSLKDMVKHFLTQPYGKRVIGMRIVGGFDVQWYQWRKGNILPDYSPKVQAEFKQKYGHNKLPSVKERLTENTFFLDPVKDKKLIDYNRFFNENIFATVEMLAEAVKQASGEKFIVGTYLQDISYISMAPGFIKKLAGLGKSQWLKSKYLDFFGAPCTSSLSRPIGEPGGYGVAVDSVKLNGKLWLNEDDLRTFKAEQGFGSRGKTDTPRDSIEIIKRQFALAYAKRVGAWYYDMWGGWFNSPSLTGTIKKLKNIYQNTLTIEDKVQAQVAVIVDEESIHYLGSETVTSPLIYYNLEALKRAGFPFDVYHTADLASSKLDQYKVYIFLNQFALSWQQRELIRNKLQKDGKSLVWLYAPGYINPDNNSKSLANIASLTGLSLRKDNNVDFSIDYSLIGVEQTINTNLSKIPRFFVAGSNIAPLAKYVKGGFVCAGIKKMKNWNSVYLGFPGEYPTVFWRNLAKRLGVHCYINSEDGLYVGPYFIGIHNKSAGKIKVDLREKLWVYDLWNDKLVAKNVKEFVISPQKNSTSLFLTAPKQIIDEYKRKSGN